MPQDLHKEKKPVRNINRDGQQIQIGGTVVNHVGGTPPKSAQKAGTIPDAPGVKREANTAPDGPVDVTPTGNNVPAPSTNMVDTTGLVDLNNPGGDELGALGGPGVSAPEGDGNPEGDGPDGSSGEDDFAELLGQDGEGSGGDATSSSGRTVRNRNK